MTEPIIKVSKMIYGSGEGKSAMIPNYGRKAKKKCEVCRTGTYNNAELSEHYIKTHPRLKVYWCIFCGKVLRRKQQCFDHLRTHVKEKWHICNLCGNESSSGDNLQRHIRTHTLEKPFKCRVCEKAFSRRYILHYHSLTHTLSKHPLACLFCQKWFHAKNNLEEHINTHTHEKPFFCRLCTKSYIGRSGLIYHEKKIHCLGLQGSAQITNIKSHKCNICEKLFSSVHSLGDHIRGHTGERPFKCQYCQREFALNSSWRRHEKLHFSEDEWNHKCNLCDKRFPEKRYLDRHKRSFHEG